MSIIKYESPLIDAITIQFIQTGSYEIRICTIYLNIFLLPMPELPKWLLLTFN